MKTIRYTILLVFLTFSVISELRSQSTDVGTIPASFGVSSGATTYTIPIECPRVLMIYSQL